MFLFYYIYYLFYIRIPQKTLQIKISRDLKKNISGFRIVFFSTFFILSLLYSVLERLLFWVEVLDTSQCSPLFCTKTFDGKNPTI